MAAALWNPKMKTGKQRNAFLFKNDIMSDCSFIVIEGTKKTQIPAHKCILGSNSEEFYNLFYLLKANNEIPIDDTSAKDLISFLQFLYTDTTLLTMDNISELIKLAKRYSVNHFKGFCEVFLSANINITTALSIMDMDGYNFPNLIRECVKLISQNPLILQSPSFFKISIKTITDLLKSEQLKEIEEIMIFDGIDKWAEDFCRENNQTVNSCNKRLSVLPALPYIRFASMSSKEFTSCTVGNSILIQTEIVEIFQSICSGGQIKCMFSDIKRDSTTLNKIKIFEFSRANVLKSIAFNELWGQEIFRFTVNNPIRFHGIGLHGGAHPSESQLHPDSFIIQLTDKNNKILLKSDVKIYFDGTDKIYDVFFEFSKFLKSNITYTVKIQRQAISNLYQYCNLQHPSDIKKEYDGIFFDIKFSNPSCQSIFFSHI